MPARALRARAATLQYSRKSAAPSPARPAHHPGRYRWQSRQISLTPHARRTHFAKLAVVDHQHVIARVTHRPVLNRQLFQVIAGRPLLAVDPRRRVKAISGLRWLRVSSRLSGIKSRCWHETPHRTGPRGTGVFLQGQKGVQGAADAGEGQGIVNGVNNPRRGGPAVEEGHLMGLQQRGRMASGTAFFLDQPGFDR